MIRSLKLSALRVLKQTGVAGRIAQSRWRRMRLLILCYHGVSLADEHEWNPGLYVSPAHLEERLAMLRRHRCAVLPLGEALERLGRADLPDRAVVLTFDDGYYDFLARAWPLLRAHDMPATVYLTTARVEHNLPNVNLFMAYALWKARGRSLDGRGIAGLGDRCELGTDEQRSFVLQQITGALQRRGSTEPSRDATARLLVERLELDYGTLVAGRTLTLMRATEVARCSAEGVDVQLHTHLHRTPEDPDEFLRDVIVNRDRIEAITHVRPTHLCYPSGNYRRAYLPGLRQHGIVSATTCDPGIATRRSDPLILPRFIDTTPMSSLVFEAWITGVAACLPRRTRRGGYTFPPEPVSTPPVSRRLMWSGK